MDDMNEIFENILEPYAPKPEPQFAVVVEVRNGVVENIYHNMGSSFHVFIMDDDAQDAEPNELFMVRGQKFCSYSETSKEDKKLVKRLAEINGVDLGYQDEPDPEDLFYIRHGYRQPYC